MKKSRKKIIPLRSTQITAVISVTLVLLILGVVAMLGIMARNVSRDIKQQIGFVVVMADTVSQQQITAFNKRLDAIPSVKTVEYSDAERVMDRWKELTGENDIEETLVGINPFSPEFEVSVKEDYANPDSLAKIIAPISASPEVSEVIVHSDIARSVNETIRSMTFLLLIIAGGLLVISFILINNTIRLTVYSRRFLIHTMKLVGATPGFIRRPLVMGNFLQGAVASFLAILILAAALFYVETIDPEIVGSITWNKAAAVFAGIFIFGTLICTVAGILSANRYLRTDYDDMF